MKLAFFSTKNYDKEYFGPFNHQNQLDITFYESALHEATADLAKNFDAVCVFVNDKVNKEVLSKLHQYGIKIVALRSAGFNHVDLESAEAYQIKIVRVPAYSPNAVAEHAIALILTLNRKTHKAYNRVREGNFSLERLTGFNLHNKTIGVIGTGKIGIEFCKIMNGFGCNILAYDPYPTEELASYNVKYSSLEELLKSSDIISLHCPLTTDTRHIINKNTLKTMKDGVMIINTSRGGLVNTKDAIKALKKRKIGYLGIDVYEQEEDLFFHDFSENIIDDETIMRLISFPNVLITSHQAFFTREALEQIATTTIQNLKDFENGHHLKNEVTLKHH